MALIMITHVVFLNPQFLQCRDIFINQYYRSIKSVDEITNKHEPGSS